jgi:glucosamine-6-phosphate deaminase
MNIQIEKNPQSLGIASGTLAANTIRKAIAENGEANIILATGASQIETLQQVISEKEIDWSKVTIFHLDEYIGLPITHGASFRKYLIERFVEKVPTLKEIHLIDGENNPEVECKRLAALISKVSIDLAFVGIGENGHLAFNDPPADFETEDPYIVVDLDEGCRKQQWGEGWFETLEEVPKQAISMSIKQIMKTKHLVCTVPDVRKSDAVKNCLENEVSNLYPASILQLHNNCNMLLDENSASKLKK